MAETPALVTARSREAPSSTPGGAATLGLESYLSPTRESTPKEVKHEGNYDVVIVGAGPSGLMLGRHLDDLGVNVAIVESEHKPNDTSKGMLLTAPVLRSLPVDYLASFVSAGTEIKSLGLMTGNKHITEMKLDKTDQFPKILSIPQNIIEKILLADLAKRNVPILRCLKLDTLEWLQTQSKATEATEETESTPAPFVRLMCSFKDSFERLSTKSVHLVDAQYVVACDGGRSTVRALLGKKSQSLSNVVEHLTVDATVRWGSSFKNDSIYVVQNTGGSMLCVPMKDHEWRLIISSFGDINEDTKQVFTDSNGMHPPYTRVVPPEKSEVQHCLDALVPGSELQKVNSIVAFSLQEFVVDSFTHDRVILCGDSAHVTQPTTSEGLNLAIMDAINLSWKLAALVKGGSEELLESYETERLQAANDAVYRSFQLLRFALKRGVVNSMFLNAIGPVLSRIESLKSKIILQTFNLDVKYPPNPCIGSPFLGTNFPPGTLFPTATVAEIDVTRESYPLGRDVSVMLRSQQPRHVLFNFVRVLPPGTKVRTYFGCQRSEEAKRWNQEVLKSLCTLSRVMTDGLKASQLQVVWVLTGLAESKSLSMPTTFVPDDTTPRLETETERLVAMSPEPSYFSDLHELVPNELLQYLGRTRIPGKQLVLLDYAQNGLIPNLGLTLKGSDLPGDGRDSGAFILVRPDGVVAFEGLASDSNASATAVDYCMRLFGR